VEDVRLTFNGAKFHVTISAGLALLDPDEHQSVDQFIQTVDSKLYTAKTAGRNQVVA
jgi:PleD family two-component response regulator